MAAIGNIRKHSVFLITIIGVALAAFILGDFLKKRPRPSYNIGVIDGKEIPIQEFNKRVDENVELAKQNYKKKTLSSEENYSIRQNTWRQIVNQLVLGKEYDELGLVVSSDELFDQVQGNNPHAYIRKNFKDPKTGKYNPKLVIRYLQNMDRLDPVYKKQWIEIEKYIKNDRLLTKYKDLISKSYYLPESLAKRYYKESREKTKFRFIAYKYRTMPDSLIKLTDEDYKKYYDKNSYKYKQEESRDIDYVIFDVKASAKDKEQIAKEVDEIYNEFKTVKDNGNYVNANSDTRYDSSFYKKGSLPHRIDSIMFHSKIGTIVPPYIENNTYHIAKLTDIQYRPDSIKASHILITYKGARVKKNITRSKEQAKELADSLFKVIKRNPKKFDKLVETMSDYPNADKNKGNIGWFTDGNVNFYPFFNAGLHTKVGHIKMVETRLGFHILKITDKPKPVKKVRVAIIDRSISPSNQTFQNIYIKASRFVAKNHTEEAFEKAFMNEKLNKRTAKRVKKMDDRIPGINYPREIIRWAYNKKTEKGDVSKVFDVQGKYVVAMLKEIHHKGIKPLEQIKDQIKPFVLREKKADMIISKMNDALNSTKDINKLALELNKKVDTLDVIDFASYNIPGYGREMNVIGSIFSLKKGELSKPIKGENAVFVVVVDDFTKVSDLNNYALYKNHFVNNFKSRVDREVYKALEDKAEIKDNRIKFY